MCIVGNMWRLVYIMRVDVVVSHQDHPSGVLCRNGRGSQGFRRDLELLVFESPTLRILANLGPLSDTKKRRGGRSDIPAKPGACDHYGERRGESRHAVEGPWVSLNVAQQLRLPGDV
jgi:hypothetical protein